MRVVPYNSKYREEWDKFVLSNAYSCPGQHSGIFDFEKALGRKNYSYILLDEHESLIGIMPLFLHQYKIKKVFKIKRLISSSSLRNGPLFSMDLSIKQQDQALELFIKKLLEDARSMGVDDICISYPTMHDEETSLDYHRYFPLKRFGFREGNTVAMIKDLRCEEEMLFKSLKYNCQKSIRRCIEEGGEFIAIKDRSLWMDCFDLNIQTFREENAPPFPKKIMEILWDSFVENNIAEVTGIKLRDSMISVMITTTIGKSCYPWIGFNSKPQPIPGASNLLIWKTMLYFKEKGIQFFEIGSREFSNAKQIRISKYKESFNGQDYYCLDGSLVLCPIKKSLLELLSYLRDYLAPKSLDFE